MSDSATIAHQQETIAELRMQIAAFQQNVDELRAEVAYLRAIIDHIPVAVAVKDQHRRYILANDYLSHVLPQPAQQVVGRSDDEIWPPDLAATFQALDRAALETEGPVIRDIDLPEREPALTLRVYTFPLHLDAADAEHSTSMGMVGVDVTSWAQSETVAQKHEERLAAIVNSLDGIVWSTNARTHRVRYLSPAVEAIYGHPPSDFFSNPRLWYEMIHPEDTGAVSQHNRFLFQNGVAEVEYRIVRPDGEIRWLLVRSSLVYDRDGNPSRVDGITTDVTERKMIEDALRQSEARYRLIANNATDMLSRHRPDGVYLYASPACTALLGYQPEDLVGTRLDEWVHPDDMALVQMIEHPPFDVSTSEAVRYRIRHKDGRYIWFETTMRIVSDPATGNVSEIIAVSRNISERKQIEARLEHSLALLQATIESTAEGILVISNSDEIVSYNQRLIELWDLPDDWLDYTSGQARFKLLVERVTNPQAFIRRVSELRSNPALEGHDTVELKNGRFLERSSMPYRIGETIVGRVWSFRDVTDRRRAEDLLRASQVRLKAIFDHADVGIGLADTDGYYQQVNHHWSELLGCDAEAMCQMTYRDIVHPEDAAAHELYLQMLLAGEIESYRLESRFASRSGAYFWGALSVSSICNDQGRLEAVLYIVVDITEQKRMQEAERAALDLTQMRAAELEQLKHFAETLNQAVSPDKALQDSLNMLAHLVDARAGWLWIVAETGEPTLIATYNLAAVPYHDAIMHPVSSSCECLRQLLDNELEEPSALIPCSKLQSYQPDMPQTKTHHTSISIKAGGRPVGLLNLVLPDERTLSPSELRLFQAVRDQFGVAMERAVLFAQTTEDLRREQRLNEVTRAINSALDVPTVLQTIVRLIVELVGAEVGDMGLINAEGDQFTFPYFFNVPQAMLKARNNLPKRSGLFYHVFESGESILLDEYSNHPGALPHFIATGLHSVMIVPIIAGDERIGVLGLYNMTTWKRFSERDLALAESVGRQAGIAIQNARLYESERQRVRTLDALRAIMNEVSMVSMELELHDLLRNILQRAIELLHAHDGELALYDDTNHELEVLVNYNLDPEFQGTRQTLGEGIMGHVGMTRQPLIVHDYQTWEGRSLAYDGLEPHAMLAVPLLAGSRFIGVIGVGDTDTKRTFTQDDVQIFSLFAQQATISIQNAQLFEDAQRRAEEAETLRQAGAVVAASLNQDESIERILEQLEYVVPYDSASVQLLRDGMLEIVGGRGFPNRESVVGLRFAVDYSNPGQVVFREWQPHILADAPALYPAFRQAPHDHIRSWLGVPLVFQEKLIGMLALDSTQPDHFTPHHAKLVAAFADQVAIALEHARLFAEMQHMAITDPLTLLYNRRHFFDLAYREVNRTKRYRSPLSAIMLDVDHFKRVNDQYGHAVGDQVLRAVAKWCRSNLRATDIIGRYGGEEFVILLPETDHKQARMVAENMREKLEQTLIVTDSQSLQITVSLGIATMTARDSDELDDLLNRADHALLLAKSQGRNRIVTWDEQQTNSSNKDT
jgi:diguanylate cyclase (GGDEF)-like protein/PAS domain S-box-containing protein